MCPDIRVIVLRGRPVGLLEVTMPTGRPRSTITRISGCPILTPSARRCVCASGSSTHLRVLRHQFGVSNPYAIGTTYEQWRVFHLSERDDPTGPQRHLEATRVISGHGAPTDLCTALVAALQCMRRSILLPLADGPPAVLDASVQY